MEHAVVGLCLAAGPLGRRGAETQCDDLDSLDVAVKKGIQVKNCALLALLGAWWHLRGFSELGAGWHGWPGKWFKSPLQESGSGDTSNELPSSHKIILTDTHLYNPPLIPIDKQNLDLF